MRFLLDTVTVSELRKRDKADARVVAWMVAHRQHPMYLSALTIGELWAGVAQLYHRNDRPQAEALHAFYNDVRARYADVILPITLYVAERWAATNVPNKRPTVDSLIAATAWSHDLAVVTRNVSDFEGADVRIINPWDG